MTTGRHQSSSLSSLSSLRNPPVSKGSGNADLELRHKTRFLSKIGYRMAPRAS